MNRIFILIVTVSLIGCNTNQKEKKEKLTGELTIFHAGSLSLPMKAAVDSFKKINPLPS